MSVEHRGEHEDKLLTIADICTRHGVSRQTLHNLRVKGVFPQPVPAPGSTRQRWWESAVDEYFEEHPLRPGARTDLTRDQPGEE